MLPRNYQAAFSCIVETQARREGLKAPLRALKRGGLLILKSRLIMPEGFPLGLVVRRHLHLIGVHYAPFSEAIKLLSQPDFPVEDLFGDYYLLRDFSAAFTAGEAHKVFFDLASEACVE